MIIPDNVILIVNSGQKMKATTFYKRDVLYR